MTTSKFVETLQGVLSLKFFFHSGIAKTQGDEVSSVSVKKMIEDLVAKEELTKPSPTRTSPRPCGRRASPSRGGRSRSTGGVGILPSHQRRLAVRKRA